MTNPQERIALMDKINGGFKFRPSFLFIGKHTTADALPERVANLSWSGVISLSDDNNMIDAFNRSVKRKVTDVSDPKAIRANRDNMPFIYLSRFLDIAENDSEKRRKKLIEKTLTNLLDLLLSDGDHLYVIGYHGDDFDFFEITKRTRSVYFFGITKDSIEEPDKKYKYIEEPLETFIPDISENDEEEPTDEENASFFYINGKVKSIPQFELVKTSSYICLADKAQVESFIPFGRQMQKKYFLKFLETSSSAFPQWYAYAPNTEFNIKRSFEDGLIKLVERALSGDPMPGDRKENISYDSSKPIVLMGPPSSSKSIALGALAYRFYKERNYPVLYVRSDFFRIPGDRTDKYEELEDLMQKISSLDENAKILLICDCSSATNGLKESKRIARFLNNRGRRFVLVASSYEHKSEETPTQEQKKNRFTEEKKKNRKAFYWDKEEEAFRQTKAADPEIENTDSFFKVRSTRTLDKREIEAIDRLFKNHGGLDKSDGSWWKSFKEENDDIFDYFYKLAFIVRESLQSQLNDEQDVFRDELERKLKDIYTLKSNSIGSLFPEWEKLYEDDAERQGDLQKRLERFQNCVALFSRYLIPAPRALAMKTVDNSINTSVVYSTGGLEHDIERFLTTSIPWIKYREIGGSFFFLFRNTREAGIYLKNVFGNEHNNAEAFKFILYLLDFYKGFDSCDPGIVNALSELLRSVGPNKSETFGDNSFDLTLTTEQLKDVTDKMEEIRDELDCNCTMALTRFTFLREYYGKRLSSPESKEYSKEDYETIMKALIETAANCRNKYDSLNPRYDRSIMAQLQNERTLCLLLHEMCLKKYNEKYPKTSDPRFQSQLGTNSFSDLFSSLESVIHSNPTNGFYYNTLFKLFEQRFPYKQVNEQDNASSLKSAMLAYSGRIASIVDLSNSVEVESTGASGSDELGQHKAYFVSFLANAGNIGIDNISKNPDFAKIFDDALERGDASYIWLICYKELLETENNRHSSYKKIFNFMYSGERNGILIFDVIKKDLSALHVMLRTYWLFNAREEPQVPHTNVNECRFTHFKNEEWGVINEITSAYCDLCQKKGTAGNPFLRYIYALSELYVNGLSEEGFGICKRILSQGNEQDYDYSGLKRMYTPFVLCGEDGKPLRCDGTVTEAGRYQYIKLSIVLPSPYKTSIPTCYARRDILNPKAPNSFKEGDRLKDIAVGVRFTGFSAYSIDLVYKWEERRKENGR